MSANPRVLVVDDDEIIATTLAMILNTQGFDAVAAFNGPQALQIAEASHFDILVTDVMMAPMNGIETGIAFRQLHPEAHVFLFTGTTEAAQLMYDAVNAGFNFRLFSKPIDPAQIIHQLRALCSVTI